MKHVPRQWLRWFQLVLLGLDAIILVIYIYDLLFGSGQGMMHMSASEMSIHGHHGIIHTGSTFGINTLIAVLAGIHMLYVLGFVWWFDKRWTWYTHASAIFLSGAVLVLLTNSDSSYHMWYHLIIMLFMFFTAMAGFLVVGAIFTLAFALLIVSSLGSGHLTSDPSGHVIEMVLVMISGVSGSAGYFIFSKKYVQIIDAKALATLTNLVKRERTTVDLLLESITDGVMIISTTGAIELMNNSAAKILGWTKDEAHNLPYTTLLQQADNPEEVQPGQTQTPKPKSPLAIAQALKGGKPEQLVSLIKTRDQRQVYVDITASPIYQEQDSAKKVVGIIAVLRNVDKQKREEQQRTEFISTASHEMRTPVAAIEGYLALALNEKVSGIDQKARGYLEKAHESTQHLGKLFQDLLTSTKAEDGRLSSHPIAVEMGQYLEQLVESLRFGAEKKGLFMDFIVGTGTPQQEGTMTGKVVKPLYYVEVDPDRIREAITNLFDNAVKYTSEGKVSIGLTGNDQVVQTYVRDTGPGIPPDDIPHLFQKFYRVDNSATRTIGGTGLGLFICRKIVELYKGRIWVESELGKGSTFYINLPRLSAAKAVELEAAQAANAQNVSQLSA